ncbi:MAG: hypothetical protein FWD51_04660 [Betaproteobacteria bacterium]|nr:hypothetical protein [Betaproteobacteria bacterium]
MKMKSIVLAAALSVSFATTAFAGEAQQLSSLQTAPAAVAQQTFDAADMQQLFGQESRSMQLATLSQQEMRETEGAFWPLPVLLYAPAATNFAWMLYNSSLEQLRMTMQILCFLLYTL